ncbi:DUF1330 domain-containing protein [Taklimakanibacter deserti]|jgi:uncharacterized protein (DUF1330 family)|uniref:DUF1330 domain-containing protein n=1 Tax=Taklimakanibacter deserti TaxID=2267839 RepID=UPI000E6473AA
MPKGYWMVHVTVKDPERYKDYVAANKAPLEKYGAKFIVRGGNYEVVKGASRERHVVLEFPSFAAAKECFFSPEYQAALAIFKTCAESDVVIVEGAP